MADDKRRRFELRLDDETSEALERAGGDRSEYVRRLIREAPRAVVVDAGAGQVLTHVGDPAGYTSRLLGQTHADAREALLAITDAGWERAEILAACDALNGVWMRGYVGPAAVALELADAERLNGLSAKWSTDPARWEQLVVDVAGSPELSHALVVVVRDFWRDTDGWLERKLRTDVARDG